MVKDLLVAGAYQAVKSSPSSVLTEMFLKALLACALLTETWS